MPKRIARPHGICARTTPSNPTADVSLTARTRKAWLLVLTSALCAVLGYGPAQAAPTSPPQKTVFITANLLEGFSDQDLKSMTELPIFVNRVLTRAPFDPDVLLLQEVRRKSATEVARLFSIRTGHRYVVAFGGARDIYSGTSRRINVRDTAILLNTSTMTKVGSGGWIEVKKNSAADRPMYKGHAYGFARRNGTNMTYAMVSVHTQNSSITESTKKIANSLASKRPDIDAGRYNVIGGDFNTSRLTSPNNPAPYWSWLTGSPRNYRDALYAVRSPKSTAVDYIFAQAGVYAAGLDASYNNKSLNPATFYSDHAFRWAALGPDRVAPSTPRNLQARNENSGIRLSWTGSTDTGGSGLGAYEIYRVKQVGQPQLIGTSAGSTFEDKNTYYTKRYEYIVRARDGAHNRTAPTASVHLIRRK